MSYPDPLKNIGYYDELFIDDIEKIEENWADYIRLEGMDSTTSFTLIEDFISEMVPLKEQEEFYMALSRGKPFRRFNDLIADYPELRKRWFHLKLDKNMKNVAVQFKRHYEQRKI